MEILVGPDRIMLNLGALNLRRRELKFKLGENVYDSSTGAWLLIPQGARLLGVYDSQITQGQKRVGIVWNRIVYPDGSSLNISGSPGADMEGCGCRRG